jgi:triosephosphate isomerase (TIM)
MNIALVLGNWKMYKTCSEAIRLVQQIKAGLVNDHAEVGVIPPFTAIAAVSRELADSSIMLGAQDVYPAAEGAFTGEIAPPMLAELGVHYVLCGHSERRHVLGENDELVGRKVAAVADAGMTPVLCVGEKLEERDRDETEEVLLRQMTIGLEAFKVMASAVLVVAYEPVWAIGTGRVATSEQVAAAHRFIRDWLAVNLKIANQPRILYGGSVKPENVDSLYNIPEVNGFLVGGASLKADSFLGIINIYG